MIFLRINFSGQLLNNNQLPTANPTETKAKEFSVPASGSSTQHEFNFPSTGAVRGGITDFEGRNERKAPRETKKSFSFYSIYINFFFNVIANAKREKDEKLQRRNKLPENK